MTEVTIDLACFGPVSSRTIGMGLLLWHIAQKLQQRDSLGRFYALMHESEPDIFLDAKEPIPFSPYVIGGLNRVLSAWGMGYDIRRGVQEYLFDLFLSANLTFHSSQKVLFSHDTLPRSARWASRRGLETYLLAATPHCDMIKDLVVRE